MTPPSHVQFSAIEKLNFVHFQRQNRKTWNAHHYLVDSGEVSNRKLELFFDEKVLN